MPIKIDVFQLLEKLSQLSPGEWIIILPTLIIFFIGGGIIVNLLKKNQIVTLETRIKLKEDTIKSLEDKLKECHDNKSITTSKKYDDKILPKTGIVIYCKKPLAFTLIPRLTLQGEISQNSVIQDISSYLSWEKSTDIIPIEPQKRYVVNVGYLTAYLDLHMGQANKEVFLQEGEVKIYIYTPNSLSLGGKIIENSK
jgi:hypothetical protein